MTTEKITAFELANKIVETFNNKKLEIGRGYSFKGQMKGYVEIVKGMHGNEKRLFLNIYWYSEESESIPNLSNKRLQEQFKLVNDVNQMLSFYGA